MTVPESVLDAGDSHCGYVADGGDKKPMEPPLSLTLAPQAGEDEGSPHPTPGNRGRLTRTDAVRGRSRPPARERLASSCEESHNSGREAKARGVREEAPTIRRAPDELSMGVM